MATVRDYSLKWEYKLVDIGLSVKWMDRNFLSGRDTDCGLYLPFGMTYSEHNKNYCFTEISFEDTNFFKNIIEKKDDRTSVIATDYDVLFKYDKALRLPSEYEIEELIYNCYWAVVFQHIERESYKKEIKPGRYQTIGMNRELIVYLDEEYAFEETINQMDDYAYISDEEVYLMKNYGLQDLPALGLPNKWDFAPAYLIAFKTHPDRDGIKFPFSGRCEFDWDKNNNQIFNSNTNKSDIKWSVEVPFGNISKGNFSNNIGILDYSVTINDSLDALTIFKIPKRPIIKYTKGSWIGRNYHGVENTIVQPNND